MSDAVHVFAPEVAPEVLAQQTYDSSCCLRAERGTSSSSWTEMFGMKIYFFPTCQ